MVNWAECQKGENDTRGRRRWKLCFSLAVIRRKEWIPFHNFASEKKKLYHCFKLSLTVAQIFWALKVIHKIQQDWSQPKWRWTVGRTGEVSWFCRTPKHKNCRPYNLVPVSKTTKLRRYMGKEKIREGVIWAFYETLLPWLDIRGTISDAPFVERLRDFILQHINVRCTNMVAQNFCR